ncbi:bicaudal D-related protein homolog [Limulus polyphemus]|uniref:Bicaudal D-related protein homolog n=1 Tax=Limulus polyphemus TaxID=6850 RepID=A0ABM1BG88_LIMPO|nr:bicaudal D-related protein homolog [Limulus polyphemus]
MCACRLEKMQQTSANYHTLYGDLEEYIKEMENRTQNAPVCDDVYAQLSQKEQDLILAAQLGKALLEKNEELSLINEKLTENYSRKLELLEQEKHGLQRKLDSVEGEYESRVAELLADIAELKNELEGHEVSLKSTETEKSKIVRELQEQNHRLAVSLKQASKSEEQLTEQLKSLRQQFTVRSSNFTDHVSQLEGLREEIDILLERKYDLEQRIESLGEERENISLTLEESSDRIAMLECINKEQKQQIRLQHRDIEELRHVNTQLQAKLDTIFKRCSSPSFGQTSVCNENEMASHSSLEDELKSLNGSQIERSSPQSQPSSSVGLQGDLKYENIESDDYEMLPFTEFPIPDSEDGWKFRQELADIYYQIKLLCEDLRKKRDSVSIDSGIQSSQDEIQAQNMRIGMITAVLKELRALTHDLLANYSELPCSVCKTIVHERDLLEKVQKELKEKTGDLKMKEENISELVKKVTIQEREVAVLKEERDQLHYDIDNSKLAKDELVKKSWEVRDRAVERKNSVEIELAKTRIDMMHINSQLMEAIQQKVELSQQLEQWQVDMQVLLDEQLKTKLKNQEQEDKKKNFKQSQSYHPARNNKGKIFKLWS